MDTLINKALEPLIVTVVGALTSWVLIWLRTLIKTKTGIAISDDQFEKAKKIVQQVEEEAMSGLFLGRGQAKTSRAVDMLQAALPKIDNEKATTMIKQAVAVVPSVGATATECPASCNKVVPDDPSIPKYVTP
jgi:hypothetical protein